MRYFSERERRQKEALAARYSPRLRQRYLQTRTVHDAYDEQLEPLISKEKVLLDVGCGKKGIMQKYAGRTRLAVGADMGWDALKENQALDHVVQADAARLPFRDRCADVVISQWLFEHLPHPREVCREFARVLRPGGHLIVVTNSRFCPLMVASWLLPLRLRDGLKRLIFPPDVDEDTFPTPYRCNSFADFHGALAPLGFERVTQEYVGDPSVFLFSRALLAGSLLYESVTNPRALRLFKMHVVVHYRLPGQSGDAPGGLRPVEAQADPGALFAALLACPRCKGPVVRHEDSYRCGACAVAYPVREGIPVMVAAAGRAR